MRIRHALTALALWLCSVAAAPSQLPPADPGPPAIRVGYQVSRRSGGDQRLAALASTGADGGSLLEILLDGERPSAVPANEALELARRSRAAGIALQIHAPINLPDAGGSPGNLGEPPLESTFELARALGATVITVHLDDLLALRVGPDWERARREGITVGIENTPSAAGRPEDLIAYLKHLPGTAPVGVTLDVGHANLGPDKNAVTYARRLLPQLRDIGRRIVSVHVHDNRGDRDAHRVPGTGTVDFCTLLPLLRDEGGCTRFVIERWEGRQVALDLTLCWLGLSPTICPHAFRELARYEKRVPGPGPRH